ncbi:hypothetical protein LBMAG50_06450 [Phycisphaerae bacterium]|nr:hypothetical protein LBMAG50_06450 [Phycisphaerae bacterium]
MLSNVMILEFLKKFQWLANMTLVLSVVVSCTMVPYEPEKATRPYPFELPQGSVVQIQVVPQPDALKIINSTAVNYKNFDLWLNQRYVVHIPELLAGQTVVVPLDSMWDQSGGTPFSGGLLRYFQPTPLVLVQIQADEKSPLVGLVPTLPETVRAR